MKFLPRIPKSVRDKVWVDVLEPYAWQPFVKVIGPVLSSNVTRIAATILAVPGAAVGADALNIVEVPVIGEFVGEPARAAGIYDVSIAGEEYVFERIGDADNTLIYNLQTDVESLNLVDLQTGASGVTDAIKIVSATPLTDFDCTTLTISNSQIPKLDVAMKAWNSDISGNFASGNAHTFNVVDIGDAYAKTQPVLPTNAWGLGPLLVSGEYDKVEINVTTGITVGQLVLDNVGVRNGLVSVVDAHCGNIVVTDNLIGEGSGVGTLDPKDFTLVLNLDSGGTHVATGNVETDIEIK
jgi:hypothetical protein